MRDLALADFHITGGRVAEEAVDGAPAFRPRGDLPVWSLALPLDWNADPFGDRNWRFQLSAWRMLDAIWREYADAPSAALIDRALSYVQDWHRFHFIQGRVSDYCWDDMATGLRAQHLAWIKHEQDAGRAALSPDQRKLLLALFGVHCAKLREPGFISSNNHGIFQVHALRLMEIVAEDRSLPRTAETEMGRLLRSQFDEWGVHREGSPFYHFFAERRFRKIRPELYPQIAAQLEDVLGKAKEVTPWFVRPDGAFCAIGDSEGGYPSKPPRPAGAHASGKAASGTAILLRNMVESGYAVARSRYGAPHGQAFHLIVSGNALGGSTHDHADTLSFELFFGGRPLLVDGGKYGYQDDAWRRYFTSDRAHNTVGRADRAYAPEDSEVVGSCLSECRIVDGRCVVAGAFERKDGMRHARRILFDPDAELVLDDRVDGLPDAAKAELRLHFHEECRLSHRDDGTFDVASGEGLLARIEVPAQAELAEIVSGCDDPFFGWRSPGYRKVLAIPSLRIVMPAQVRAMRTRIALFPSRGA